MAAKKPARFPLLTKCDEKAKEQPHLTLLAQDNFTTTLLKKWIAMAAEYGTPQEKIDEAKRLLKSIEEWRTAHPVLCKTPD